MNNNKIYEDLELKQNQIRRNMRAKKVASKKQSDFVSSNATMISMNETSQQSIPEVVHHKKASKSVAVVKGTFKQILNTEDKKQRPKRFDFFKEFKDNVYIKGNELMMQDSSVASLFSGMKVEEKKKEKHKKIKKVGRLINLEDIVSNG